VVLAVDLLCPAWISETSSRLSGSIEKDARLSCWWVVLLPVLLRVKDLGQTLTRPLLVLLHVQPLFLQQPRTRFAAPGHAPAHPQSLERTRGKKKKKL
jgi:hypothetical protein